MLLSALSPRFSGTLSSLSFSHSRSLLRGNSKTPPSATFVCTSVGFGEIAETIHNKVLVSAVVSGVTGQLLKPFTSAIFDRNNNVDFKAALRSGGFPSAHSSTAVAAALSIGLERGFSDAVFGLAVVYAGLTMYDAQGVRREVGIHAKALNRTLLQNSVPSNEADLIDYQPRKLNTNSENIEPLFLEEANPSQPKQALLLGAENRKSRSGILISSGLASDFEGESQKVASSRALLKESVGHSEIEVVAGAFWGLFISNTSSLSFP